MKSGSITLRAAIGAASILVTTVVTVSQVLSLDDKFQANDVKNMRKLAQSILVYADSQDGVMPLAFGRDAAGVYMTTSDSYVPADWPSGAGNDPLYSRRIVASPSFWANSVAPFAQGGARLQAGGDALVEVAASRAQRGQGKTPLNVSYTYVGTLSSYPLFAVQTPWSFPVLWHGNGKGALIGAGHANPVPLCSNPSRPCVYAPSSGQCAQGNGGTSGFLGQSKSMWIYSKRNPWITIGLNVSLRPLGARLAPDDTDFNIDPLTRYSADGFASLVWTDGCHPWLFRPDASY